MTTSKVPLKNPAFAAFLAFLVPGLGHLYQGRTFKGLLYSICILGLFGWGMAIGDGKVVYFHWNSTENRTYAYLCQFWTGLPALPALTQARLRRPEAFAPNYVRGQIREPFQGVIDQSGERFPIEGTITIHTARDNAPFHFEGEFAGTVKRPEGPVSLEGHIVGNHLDPQVAPDRKRRLRAELQLPGNPQARDFTSHVITGFIPRSLWNSYAAPLLDQKPSPQDQRIDQDPTTDLDRAHRELGSRFELGVVYTMIAGLLNILAIYDALEGPAYGDDEDEKPPASGDGKPEEPK
jgi:TM2 domain-containing membrane protein YozV